MSRPVAGLVVVLDRNVHPDQAEATRQAMWQLKGVLSVLEVYESPETGINTMRHVVDEVRAQHRQSGGFDG